MKTKTLMRYVFLLLTFLCATILSAQRYEGSLSEIRVNGRTYPSLQEQNFVLYLDKNNLGRVKGKIAGIGKMPGYVEIDVPVRLVRQELKVQHLPMKGGRFHLKVGGGMNIVLDDWKAHLDKGVLRFSLSCYSKLAFVTMARVAMTFEGRAQTN